MKTTKRTIKAGDANAGVIAVGTSATVHATGVVVETGKKVSNFPPKADVYTNLAYLRSFVSRQHNNIFTYSRSSGQRRIRVSNHSHTKLVWAESSRAGTKGALGWQLGRNANSSVPPKKVMALMGFLPGEFLLEAR